MLALLVCENWKNYKIFPTKELTIFSMLRLWISRCDDDERCIKNRNERRWGKERKRGRTANRSRGGKEPPVKLSFAAIIAFRLVSSGSLRIPLLNVFPSLSFLCCGVSSFPLHPSTLVSTAALGASRPAELFTRGKIRTVVNIVFERVFFHLFFYLPPINCNI